MQKLHNTNTTPFRVPAMTHKIANLVVAASLLRRPITAGAIAITMLMTGPSHAQLSGGQFDEAFQRKAMRAFAGPDALCQEQKGERVCTYEDSDYAIRVSGNRRLLLARLTFKTEKAGPQLTKIGALAEAYGFTRDTWMSLFDRAMAQSAGVVGANTNDFRLECRIYGEELIFDFSVLPPKPKSTF
jgi:hypothetical protein